MIQWADCKAIERTLGSRPFQMKKCVQHVGVGFQEESLEIGRTASHLHKWVSLVLDAANPQRMRQASL